MAKSGKVSFFMFFPLLAIPVVFYNLMALGFVTFTEAKNVDSGLSHVLFSIPMVSGGHWQVTPGDLLLVVALLLLLVEFMKSAGTSSWSIANHAFSLIVSLVCIIEFLLVDAFATSVFFLLMLMTLLDVFGGFVVTIVTARRDIAVGDER